MLPDDGSMILKMASNSEDFPAPVRPHTPSRRNGVKTRQAVIAETVLLT
jgi:hypothetical protein